MRMFFLVLMGGLAEVTANMAGAQGGTAPESLHLWGITLPRPDVAPEPPFAPPDSGKLLFGLFRVLPNNVTHTIVVQPVASPDVTAVVSQASEGTASAVMGNSLLEKSGEEGEAEGAAEGEGESPLQTVSCAMTLSGDQFSPPSGSTDTAMGTIQIDLTATAVIITIDLTHSIADATSLHMHIGAPGGSGSVTIDLGSPASPIHATHAMTWDELDKASTRTVYFDIHTTTYPGGAVRGAPDCSSAIESPFCRLLLSGDQVVPAAGTDTADGYLMLVGDTSNAGFTVHLAHAISGPTAFHLHLGEPSDPGAITVNLGSGESPIDIFHQFSSGELDAITTGMPAYFDIHSTTYPGGAARGAPACDTVSLTPSLPANYSPGGTIDVTLTVDKWTPETLTSLAIQAHLPTAWSFNSIVSVDGTLSDTPSACDMNELDFTWGEIPTQMPITLVFRVNVPTQYVGTGEQWINIDGQWATVDVPKWFNETGTAIEEGDSGTGNDCPIYTLDTTHDNNLGGFSIDSSGIVFGDGSVYYILGGSSVTLFAGAGPGASPEIFNGWGGDVDETHRMDNPLHILSFDQDMTIFPMFFSGSYKPGASNYFSVIFTTDELEQITALGLTIGLPDGWQYQSSDTTDFGGNGPIVFPQANATGQLEFGWQNIPAIPAGIGDAVSVTLQILVPSGATGDQFITAHAIYRTSGGPNATHIATCRLKNDANHYYSRVWLTLRPDMDLSGEGEENQSRDGEISTPESRVLTPLLQSFVTGSCNPIAGTQLCGGAFIGSLEAPGVDTEYYSADQDGNWALNLSELLRVVQFFNTSTGFHCQLGTEDGYAPGAGDQTCVVYSTDYNPNDWKISLSELLRAVQFYNSQGYHPQIGTEDGFAPGVAVNVVKSLVATLPGGIHTYERKLDLPSNIPTDTIVTIIDVFRGGWHVIAGSLKVNDIPQTTDPAESDLTDPAFTRIITTIMPASGYSVGAYEIAYQVSGNSTVTTENLLSSLWYYSDTSTPPINYGVDDQGPLLIIEPVDLTCGDGYPGTPVITACDPGGFSESPCVTADALPEFTTVGLYQAGFSIQDAAGNLTHAKQDIHNLGEPPAITFDVTHPQNITIECNHATSQYVDENLPRAHDGCQQDISNKIVSSGANGVDLGVAGNYTITYNVTDGAGQSALPIARAIHVEDTTIPVITLQGPPTVTVECGSAYVDAGATATDSCAGDITANIISTGTVSTSTPAAYVITYNVSDPSGHAAAPKTRTVNVVDTTPPVVTLIGSAVATVVCASDYTELGASGTDTCTPTVSVSHTGAVGPDAGQYTITYSATDAAGNTGTAARTVTVTGTAQSPVVTLNGPADMTIVLGSTYRELQATATDAHDGTLAISPTSGVVVSTVIGDYLLTYDYANACGLHPATIPTRSVHVVPEIPLVTSDTVAYFMGAVPDDNPPDGTQKAMLSFPLLTGPAATAWTNYSINYRLSRPFDRTSTNTYDITVEAKDSSGHIGTQLVRGVPVKPPNFLWLNIDDLNDWVSYLDTWPAPDPYNPDDSSYDGSDGNNNLTPNLYKMARESTVFRHAYCAAPYCNPSRAAIMTGRHPLNSGIYIEGNWYELDKNLDASALGLHSDAKTPGEFTGETADPREQTLVKVLRSSGYDAYGAGKITHDDTRTFPDRKELANLFAAPDGSLCNFFERSSAGLPTTTDQVEIWPASKKDRSSYAGDAVRFSNWWGIHHIAADVDMSGNIVLRNLNPPEATDSKFTYKWRLEDSKGNRVRNNCGTDVNPLPCFTCEGTGCTSNCDSDCTSGTLLPGPGNTVTLHINPNFDSLQADPTGVPGIFYIADNSTTPPADPVFNPIRVDTNSANRPVRTEDALRRLYLGDELVAEKLTGEQGLFDESFIHEAELKTNTPFFIAGGIYRPHLPNIVPEYYFSKVKAFPPYLRSSLSAYKDLSYAQVGSGMVPPWGRFLSFEDWLKFNYSVAGAVPYNAAALPLGLNPQFVFSYEASISFADDMFGKIWTKYKNDLESSTILFLWSDHGFALGEKGHMWKHALWDRTTHAQLMVHVPGLNKHLPDYDGTLGRRNIDVPVSLMDMYPTILAMAGLPPAEHLETIKNNCQTARAVNLIPLLHGDATGRRDDNTPAGVDSLPVITAWLRPACTEKRLVNKDTSAEVTQPFEAGPDGSEMNSTCDCLTDGSTNQNQKNIPIYAATGVVNQKLYHYIDYRTGAENAPNRADNELYCLYDYATKSNADYLENTNLLQTDYANSQLIVDALEQHLESGSTACTDGVQQAWPTRFYPYDGAIPDQMNQDEVAAYETTTPCWLLSRTDTQANDPLGEPVTALTWYINRWTNFESLQTTVTAAPPASGLLTTYVKLRNASEANPCGTPTDCKRHKQDYSPGVIFFSIAFDGNYYATPTASPRGTTDRTKLESFSFTEAPKYQLEQYLPSTTNSARLLNFAVRSSLGSFNRTGSCPSAEPNCDKCTSTVMDCDGVTPLPGHQDILELDFPVKSSPTGSSDITVLFDEGDGLFTSCNKNPDSNPPNPKSATEPLPAKITHPAAAIFNEMPGD